MDEPTSPQKPTDAADRLFSDDIRRREAKRRREGPVWSVLSFLLHGLLFLAIVFCTPVRQLVFPDREKNPARRNPAEELAADRIEEIGGKLERARGNEMRHDLDALQAALHNMDLLKEELQRDYDAFAEKSADEVRDTIAKAIDEAERNASRAEAAQRDILGSADRIEKNEAANIRQEAVASEIGQMAEAIKWKQSRTVNEAQANAQNALDRAATSAEFAGFRQTAEAAGTLRDEQIETARRQSSAQDEIERNASRVAEAGRWQKQTDESRAEIEKATRDKADAEREREENKRGLETAQREREEKQSQYNAESERNRSENAKAQQADREEQNARNRASRERDQERNERNKAQNAQSQADRNPDRAEALRREAAEATARADAHKAEAEKADRTVAEQHAEAASHREQAAHAKKAADDALRERNEADRRERDARNRVYRSQDAALAAERRMKSAQDKITELEPRIAELERLAKDLGHKDQSAPLREAATAQTDVRTRIATLREALAKDTPAPEKLVREDRRENELATRETGTLSLLDSYELAKELERAVTESYKDLKATRTAIERRMGFDAAQSLTDVAMAIRPDLSGYRDILEANPRNKEELDRQKEAQAELVREADNILDTVFSMLTEAQSIVLPEETGSAWLQSYGTRIRWMDKSVFGARDADGALEERLAQMQSDAEFAVSIGEAAAEDAGEKAKDLSGLMASDEGDGPDGQGQSQDGHGDKGPASGPRGLGRKTALNGPGGDPGAAIGPSGLRRPGADGNQPPSLAGTQPGLLPGNVVRTMGEDGEDGIAGNWMYVNDWYIIGPFPNPNRSNLRRKFPPESVVDLDASYIGKDGQNIRWTFRQAASSVSNPGNRALVVPAREEYSIWYAYSEVFVDREADLWVAIGSDDRSDVWLNKMPIWGSSNELKAWNIAEGYRKVHFRAGRNTLLLRLENGHGPCGFSVCIGTGPDVGSL